MLCWLMVAEAIVSVVAAAAAQCTHSIVCPCLHALEQYMCLRLVCACLRSGLCICGYTCSHMEKYFELMAAGISVFA